MNLLKRLLARLRALTPLEERLWDALGEALPPEARALLERQRQQVNRAARLDGSREICYWAQRRGKLGWDPGSLFPNQRQEVELAIGQLRRPRDGKTWKVRFYLVRGHLFSLDFSPPAQQIQFDPTVVVGPIRLLVDPLEPSQETTARPAAASDLHLEGWVLEWHQSLGLSGLRHPLSPADRDQRLLEIEAILPADYLELVAQTDGCLLGVGALLGLAETYEVSLPHGSYYLLADFQGQGALAVAREGRDGRLFYLDYGGGPAQELGTSFRRAVEQRLHGWKVR